MGQSQLRQQVAAASECTHPNTFTLNRRFHRPIGLTSEDQIALCFATQLPVLSGELNGRRLDWDANNSIVRIAIAGNLPAVNALSIKLAWETDDSTAVNFKRESPNAEAASDVVEPNSMSSVIEVWLEICEAET